jgi:hypothetical protein
VQPSTLEAEDRQHDDQHDQPPFSTHLMFAAATAFGTVVLMVADMAAPATFVPVQIRILALAAVLGTLILYLDKRRGERDCQRHEELMQRVSQRNEGVAFVEGYVAGIRRQPPPDPVWH